MIVGIIPKIIQPYKDQFEIAIDLNLFKFLNNIFPKSKIKILFKKKNYQLDFLILSGGNTITTFSKKKEDLLRSKIDNYYYNICEKKKIPILGICHGAMFIAKKHNSKFLLKKHIGSHKIWIKKKNYTVNSFHNIIIKKITKKFNIIATAKDDSIECFVNKKSPILGMMWHPERYQNFKKLDKRIIKQNLCS